MTARLRAALIVLGALSLAVRPCGATTRNEFWPGMNAYLSIDPRTRVYLLASFTRAQEPEEEEGPQLYRDVTLGAHLDYTLKPLGKRRAAGTWERDRYVWARVGYRYIATIGDVANPSTENRVLVEMTWRFPLPGEVWATNRGRVDLRDVNDDRSQRVRYRLTLERETPMFGAATTPWVSAEFYYDSRYSDWTRTRYQTGVEIPLSKSWRIEPYLSVHFDSRSSVDQVNALGLDVKYYR